MSVEVDVQYSATSEGVPGAEEIRAWARAAIAGRRADAELSVRVVDEAEITALNRTFRGRDQTTNVLSFPLDEMPGVETPLLGDVVVCAPVVSREAGEQGKAERAHWAHMVVHGTLHLLGYDHVEPADAELMEQVEKDVLGSLGYGDPYVINETT